MQGEAPGGFSIRPATIEDVPVIHAMILDLAVYEKLSHQVAAVEDDLRRTLFGGNPAAEVLLAREGSAPVGFALYFHNYSTFLGRRGLHLEDLFVKPEFRGRGYGKALLRRLAAVARERGCRRMEWAVLNWNRPAIDFYRGLGAEPLTEWTVFRLAGEKLDALAGPER
jgi:GNAT superfamily N-acetyltransferase